ncbi:maleylacetate reductase [Kocuria sp.]|uniref:maleylacetate reductase n=1 Tax=Kocuria sp. TaxID=1871328 RepID=UPI0026E0DCCE|nr:maleylacetate reductase [Kocuria sp.]MDO5368168.1 maleylacetate reductase [Kocuria sp.]
MTSFIHDTLGQRVILDAGNAPEHLRAELERLECSNVMLIASEFESDLAAQVMGETDTALNWDEVRQHVPVENVQRARSAAAEANIDVLVSVGGGSTTGLAKAIALTTGLPIIAVPTTYAGSEATRMWGMTEDRTKSTGLDDRVLPKTVIYDSTLTLTLPVELSVASGFNGLAHCIDSMWASNTDPIAQAMALEGIRALARGLPQVVTDPKDLSGRDQCLYGAYLSAVSFASAGSGLHHKICHVLGGTFDLPHAQTHATVLPHVLAFNAPSVPEIARRISQALDNGAPSDEPAPAASSALEKLREATNAPRALRDFGMPETGIAEAVERIMGVVPKDNPTPVTEENLKNMLHDAWSGETPGGKNE